VFERASRVIGLDICGLDVVLPDISRKFEGFGGIIEVNAAPGLRMHQSPSEGQARDVGAAIIDMLFPNGSKGRIPLVAVSGNREMSTPLLGEILAFSGKCVGEAGSAGIAIGKQHIAAGDPSMSSAARIVLNDPMVEAAVLEISRDAIVESGLPFDWCDVAVFSNPEPDESDFRELGPEKLLTERVREGGTLVFHANDPRLPALREQLVDSRRLVLCSLDSNDTEIQNHLAAGGSACVLHGDWVELRHAESARRVVRASAIRGALGAATSSGLAGALAAVAASHALGLTPETVAAALVAMPATRPAYVQGINVMPLEERSKIFATMREQLRVPA
jgi:cyanophycin synthetase